MQVEILDDDIAVAQRAAAFTRTPAAIEMRGLSWKRK